MITGTRPLLLIDVDGVLSLFGFEAPAPAEIVWTTVDGFPHALSAAAGPRLVRLAATFDCAWCTGWEERAEEHLPRLLGLPGGWAHVTFAARPGAPARHWKLAAIEAASGPERPVAWIDDAFDGTCEEWAAVRPGRTLLVPTDPAEGLLDAHVTRLESWARAL